MGNKSKEDWLLGPGGAGDGEPGDEPQGALGPDEQLL